MSAPTAPTKGDRYVWTQPDGAEILVEVRRVAHGVAWLRCHHAGRSWTRRHDLPMFASMRPVAESAEPGATS